MTDRKTPKGYSLTQIRLHWVVAALIAVQYLMHDPIEEGWRAFLKGAEVAFDPLILVHVVAGVLIGAFALWRLVLRKTRGAPLPPQEEAPALKLAAHLTHGTLYALLIVMPLSGALAWFGGVGALGFVHGTLVTPLIILIGLHVVAALYHQFVLKTNLIDRMKTAEN